MLGRLDLLLVPFLTESVSSMFLLFSVCRRRKAGMLKRLGVLRAGQPAELGISKKQGIHGIRSSSQALIDRSCIRAQCVIV
uniref:Uncharacterized protein n=1 Tax=Anguilla anguilla TaxID=7936 RepID=A0A0E9RCA6_ANGAN